MPIVNIQTVVIRGKTYLPIERPEILSEIIRGLEIIEKNREASRLRSVAKKTRKRTALTILINTEPEMSAASTSGR